MKVGSAEIDIIQAKAPQVAVGQITVREIAALDFDAGEQLHNKYGNVANIMKQVEDLYQ